MAAIDIVMALPQSNIFLEKRVHSDSCSLMEFFTEFSSRCTSFIFSTWAFQAADPRSILSSCRRSVDNVLESSFGVALSSRRMTFSACWADDDISLISLFAFLSSFWSLFISILSPLLRARAKAFSRSSARCRRAFNRSSAFLPFTSKTMEADVS